MTQNDTTLKVRLSPEMTKKFNELMKKYGFENNSELVRFLISADYGRIFLANSLDLEVQQIETTR